MKATHFDLGYLVSCEEYEALCILAMIQFMERETDTDSNYSFSDWADWCETRNLALIQLFDNQPLTKSSRR